MTGKEEDGPREVEGPDFSDWPREFDEAWKLVMDIEYCDRILAAMNGPSGGAGEGSPYQVGRQFLISCGSQLRTYLGYLICQKYGIEIREEEERSPFGRAGKPRAFGAERPPDATT